MATNELYRCSECSKVLKTRGRYKLRDPISNLSKPYTKYARSQHLKTHSRPFDCEKCEKSFALRADLTRHTHARHRVGQSRIPCQFPDCGFKATRNDNLHQHIRKAHGNVGKRYSRSIDAKLTQERVPRIPDSSPITGATLLQATSAGNTALVVEALRSGINLNFTGDDGSTPLHCAARAGQSAMVEQLIISGARIEAKNDNKRTPLHEAALSKNAQTFYTLLNKGASLHDEDVFKKTVADYLVENSEAQMLKVLTDRSSVEIPATVPRLILHKAILARNEQITSMLIAHPNIRVNELDGNGYSPLHLAIKSNNVKAAQQLLDREDTDVNLARNGIHPPLLYACSINRSIVKKRLDFVSLLLRHKEIDPNAGWKFSTTPLHAAIKQKASDEVKLLLEHPGTNLHLKDQRYRTIAREAAWSRNAEVINLFIDRHYGDSLGYTELHLRVLKNDPRDLHQLSEQQSINARDYCGDTPLNLATKLGYLSIVKQLLVLKDCNPNIPDRHSVTPLQAACQRGEIGLVELFLGCNTIEVGVRGKTQNNLLHFACEAGHTAVLRLLLGHSLAQINSVNTWGNTPLHIACKSGKFELVELLLRHNANVNAHNSSGESSPHISHRNTNLVLVGLLSRPPRIEVIN